MDTNIIKKELWKLPDIESENSTLKIKLEALKHHTLFFDADFEQHATEIYDTKKWPKKPLFYVCTPSKTDPNVAPSSCENLFLLMPLATGIEDTEELREKYFKTLISRLEDHLGERITDNIVVKKSYCIKDFENDYNAFGGNAYGLANTLSQTAIFKPKIINKKIKNLVYTGQLTVPGPGVPPSIISGKISANLLSQTLKEQSYEITIWWPFSPMLKKSNTAIQHKFFYGN